MTYLRRLILAAVLMAGLIPAFAQVPSPVPALPDSERRTTYTIAGTTCSCAVGFALYGTGTDYQNWVEVWLNGTRVAYNDATYGWTLTSPSGSLSTLARPITNAIITFNSAQTGTVQIVGANRPRRTAQFSESRGVTARDMNQALTDLVAQNRETWDRTNDVTGRAVLGLPGETVGPLPAQASRASKFFTFDSSGNPSVTSPTPGLGNVIGPATSTIGHFATWANTTGTTLADSGIGNGANWAWSGVIVPSALGSSVNDYSPTGLSTATTLLLSESGAAAAITGIAAQPSGTFLTLVEVSGNTIILSNQSASSSAANRFDCGSDVFIGPKQSATVWYDVSTSRWKCWSTPAYSVSSVASYIGTISPTQITADQNDYDPTNGSVTSVWRLSSDATRTITGISGYRTGAFLSLLNVGSNNIVLSNQNASSSAANRFSTGYDIVLAANQSATVWYDITSSRWRLWSGAASSLPPGIDTNTLNAQTANYTLATTDCGKTVTLGGSAFYTLTVGAASGFPSTCSVVVANIDTGRGKKMTINGITFPNSSILWPTQTFTLKNENNAWTLVPPPGRWKLASSVQFEVNTAGSNSNDCLGTGASGACATITGAINIAAQVLDAAQQFVKVHLDCSGAPSTYTGQALLAPIVGQAAGFDPSSNKTPIISGDTTTPTNCVVTSASGSTIQAVGGVSWNIEGVKLTNTDGSSACVLVDEKSTVRAGVLNFGSCNGASGNHIVVENFSVYKAAANYTISAGANVHVYSTLLGSFLQSGVTVTLSGTPAWGFAFAYAERNSTQLWSSATFSGASTGTRYTAILGGGIETSGGGASFLPGNAAGSATNPGWYN